MTQSQSTVTSHNHFVSKMSLGMILIPYFGSVFVRRRAITVAAGTSIRTR